jgi:RimJ/RimL family protein N-acetyltransferase
MILEKPIETHRLILRELREEDWQAVYEYASDPLVTQFMPIETKEPEDTKAFLQKKLAEQKDENRKRHAWAIVLKAENQLIGGCGLHLENEHNGMIGYVLNRRHWGQGYATETARALLAFGFEHFKRHRITAQCDVQNAGSYHVMEKLGMRREGHLRQDIQIHSQWRNSYLYAILEDEWRNKQS